MSKPHIEYEREYFCGRIIKSSIRPATELEIQQAKERYIATQQCDCSIVVDEYCWMYDFRHCYICGKGLGTV